MNLATATVVIVAYLGLLMCFPFCRKLASGELAEEPDVSSLLFGHESSDGT